MSFAAVRIVARGSGAAHNDEVWVDGIKLPGVRDYRVEASVDHVHRLVVTFLADPVLVEYEANPDEVVRSEPWGLVDVRS